MALKISIFKFQKFQIHLKNYKWCSKYLFAFCAATGKEARDASPKFQIIRHFEAATKTSLNFGGL